VQDTNLLVIGIDAACWPICQREGFFLHHGQASRALAWPSSWKPGEHQPLTGPNWTNIYTGVLPEAHGVLPDPWIKGQTSYRDISRVTVFDLMSNYGTFLMPMTWGLEPPEDSWCVPGWICPERSDVAVGVDLPTDFRFEAHPLGDNLRFEDYQKADYEERGLFFRYLRDIAYEQLTVFRNLPKKETMFLGVLYLDWVNHACGNSKELSLLSAYDWLDKILLDIIEDIKPKNLLICSDHGMSEKGGNHSAEGICVVRSDFKDNARFVAESNKDIAPFILELAGVPLKDHLGKKATREKMSDTDQEELEKHIQQLAALGYIDSKESE